VKRRRPDLRRRGRALKVALVLILFIGTMMFLLWRTGVIGPGESPADWPVPDPDLSTVEPRVRDAVSRARQGVLDSPSSAAAWGRLGVACDAHFMYAGAAESYRRAHELAPEEFTWAYHVAASRFYEAAPVEEVIALLEAALELKPDYAPGHVRLGDLRGIQGDMTGARQAYARAIELEPDMAVARRAMGQTLLAIGEIEEAVRQLEQAERLAPGDRAVATALAQGYQRLGRTERADELAARSPALQTTIGLIDPLRQAVDDEGVSIQACDRRADRRIVEGRHAEAIEDLLFVVEHYPDDPRTHVRLGRCYQQTGQIEPAVRHLVRALEIDDNQIEPHGRLVDIYWGRDWGRAAFHLRRLLDLESPTADRHTSLAIALANSGDIDGAIASFRAAAALAPEAPDKHSDLARALAIKGDLDGAVAAAKLAIALDANHGNANLILGQIYDERGEVDKAIDHYRRAVRANPASPAATRLMELTAKRDGGGS